MSYQDPPKLPLKLFRWFCTEERLEELEGDLFEVYQELVEVKGSTVAGIIYWWLVIRSFRSYALKSTNRNKPLKIMTHFKHNFTVAWRNLLKHKTTTAINLLGLSIGIATFLGIITIVRYEFSFNKEIPNSDRIYRIYTSFGDGFFNTNPGVAHPIGPYIEENFKDAEALSHLYTWYAKVQFLDKNQTKTFGKERNIVITSPAYFDVIEQYEWLAGSKESLNRSHKVILTDKQAIKYFGSSNWSEIINQELSYNDSLRVEITGIVRQSKSNSDFNFTEFISFSTLENSWLKDYFSREWGNTNSASQVFVKLRKSEDLPKLHDHLLDLDKHAASFDDDPSWTTNYKAQPLADIHFNTEMGNFDNERIPVHQQTLVILSIVGFVILLIAIFNFINLETAQSTLKSKEVGVRKVLGSAKSLLVGRFLTESGIVTISSTLLAIPLAHFGLKYFSDFLPPELAIDYSNPMFWASLIFIMIVVSLMAGFYPSWIISSFKT